MGLITAQEVKTNTSMGGNVDADKFMHLLYDVQVLILEPMLGTALYEKIVEDFEAGTLIDEYLEMFTKYIKPTLWHSVYAQYLRDGIVLAMNTGIYENSPENGQSADIENIKYIVKSAQSKADVYFERLERYLCDKNIPEYENSQPNEYDLDPRQTQTISGWWLNGTGRPRGLPRRGSGGDVAGDFLELE